MSAGPRCPKCDEEFGPCSCPITPTPRQAGKSSGGKIERVDRPDPTGRYRNPYTSRVDVTGIVYTHGPGGIGFDPGAAPFALGSMADLAHELRNMPPVRVPPLSPVDLASLTARFRDSINSLTYPTRRKP